MTPATKRRVLAASAALAAYAAGSCASQPAEPQHTPFSDAPKLNVPRSIETADSYRLPAPRPPRAARGAAKGRSRVARGPLPPESVARCESGGRYDAENPTSSASGKWQIVDGSWGGYGGYEHASDAPPEVQDARAAQLWAGGKGASHWRACL